MPMTAKLLSIVGQWTNPPQSLQQISLKGRKGLCEFPMPSSEYIQCPVFHFGTMPVIDPLQTIRA